jgi:hypothetical protein
MMGKTHNTILLFVGLLVLSIIFFVGRCSNGANSSKENRKVYVETAHYDTIFVPAEISKTRTKWLENKIYEKIHTQINLTEQQIDSILKAVSPTRLISIAEDYYSKRFYSDTLKDSTYMALIEDSVYQNKLQHRNIKITTHQKTIIETKPQKGFMYVNGLVGGNLNSFDLGLGVGFVTKNGVVIGYTHNLIDKSNYVTIGGRLRFRR